MLSQSNGLRFNREAAMNSITETIHSDFYCADLFENKKVEPALYHYIITQSGSSEVLDWGQGFSLESMREEAREWLRFGGLKVAS